MRDRADGGGGEAVAGGGVDLRSRRRIRRSAANRSVKTARFTKKARSERLAQTVHYETMRFPFSVVYTEVEYGVLIHAVADDRRLPEYWLGRL